MFNSLDAILKIDRSDNPWNIRIDVGSIAVHLRARLASFARLPRLGRANFSSFARRFVSERRRSSARFAQLRIFDHVVLVEICVLRLANSEKLVLCVPESINKFEWLSIINTWPSIKDFVLPCQLLESKRNVSQFRQMHKTVFRVVSLT